MKNGWIIESPNNWLRRAGAYVVNNKAILPHDFLMVPMGLASEAIVAYHKSRTLNDRMRHAMAIALAVRNADTAFYSAVADMLNRRNIDKPDICQHCIRGQLFRTRMKELRRQVNKNIIHQMDNKIMINPDDLRIVEEYYEEMFKLPMMDPIDWPETKGMRLCQNCRKKWRTHSNRIKTDQQ